LQSIDPQIPRLRADIRFSGFEEASSTRGRYLVEAGESCFAVSAEMYQLLLALTKRPATLDELTSDLNEMSGGQYTTETVAQLMESRIPPALRDGQPDVPRRTPFLASVQLLSARTLHPLTSRLTWLFTRNVAIVTLTAFVIVMALSFREASASIYGWSFSMRELVALYAGIALIGLIHELGHATACFRYGCEHGGVGFGLYYIFPAFYADVTKAWRLSPKQRAVIDLGGLYFNALTLIPLGICAMMTGNHVALRLTWITMFVMLQNLNPSFKLDGYWLFSDLSGLTNLHERMAEAFARFGRRLFGRRNDEALHTGLRAGLLRLYVAAVSIYALFIGSFLVGAIGSLIDTYPRRAAQIAAALMNGVRLMAWGDVLLAAWRIVAISIWPLVLMAALSSFAFKLIRRGRKFAEEL